MSKYLLFNIRDQTAEIFKFFVCLTIFWKRTCANNIFFGKQELILNDKLKVEPTKQHFVASG
jgi:hypothetical protein